MEGNDITFIVVTIVVLVDIILILTQASKDDPLVVTLSIWIGFSGTVILFLVSAWYLYYIAILGHKLTYGATLIIIYLLAFEALLHIIAGVLGIFAASQVFMSGLPIGSRATFTFWVGLFNVITSVLLLIICVQAINKQREIRNDTLKEVDKEISTSITPIINANGVIVSTT